MSRFTDLIVDAHNAGVEDTSPLGEWLRMMARFEEPFNPTCDDDWSRVPTSNDLDAAYARHLNADVERYVDWHAR